MAAATATNRLRYVDHTYRDFSHYIEEGGELVKHKKCTNNFPARLHRMLENEEHSAARSIMEGTRQAKIHRRGRAPLLCLQEVRILYEATQWLGLQTSSPERARRLPPNLGKAIPCKEAEPNFYAISKQYPLKSRLGGSSIAQVSVEHAARQPSVPTSSTQGNGVSGGGRNSAAGTLADLFEGGYKQKAGSTTKEDQKRVSDDQTFLLNYGHSLNASAASRAQQEAGLSTLQLAYQNSQNNFHRAYSPVAPSYHDSATQSFPVSYAGPGIQLSSTTSRDFWQYYQFLHQSKASMSYGSQSTNGVIPGSINVPSEVGSTRLPQDAGGAAEKTSSTICSLEEAPLANVFDEVSPF
ncbi:hypothetical protein THAOC_04313 [Thalassiosira oceanica]|uniref:Uncharacterized protein n=1 Tax=Thalassiosira oceanica TaxID=159749 RepID=K0TP10_THAOC|nr:hypothetical protein THAOC_04313 [Thalassiosira oceanica]|eukprot:EJK74037.1 hypothetical protein THAOC_04313 [Thalassiosira oceanica]